MISGTCRLTTVHATVVAYTTSKVHVMSSGKIVEVGRPLDLFRNPQAGATQALVGAVLSVEAGLAGDALA
jgi:ABC-type glutathione transport system ATPase component